MKLCTIGCGAHAHSVHGPSQRRCASQYADVELTSCCDLNPKHAASFAQKFGYARSTTDWKEMVRREKPDAICLILPPQHIADVAVPLLNEGIAILLEKPPGLTSQDLDCLIEAAQKGGGIHQVAFNRRYTPLLVEAFRTLTTEISPRDVIQIRYEMVRHNRTDPDFSVTAIHAIDAALFLARSPACSARFEFHELPHLGAGVAAATMNVVCESGTRVQCLFQPVAGVVLERVVIHAIGMTLTVDLPMWDGFDSPGYLRLWKKDQLVKVVLGNELSGVEMFELCGFYDETVAFLNCVRADRPAAPTLEDSRNSMLLMECYRKRMREFSFLSPVLV
ncbi:MAG: hypothetical protein B9S32_10875 [Verrucomicrobia bacterium Tous-C9LFEB]|nr:MAG: hypothetical protein B9S32_10875 [Verrucomicrobia bacterium Tous-C9LFEB]